jgi:hypothetical protein
VVTKAYLPWATVLVVNCGVFTGGLIWSGLFARYRSIWPGYISHILADTAIFVIGFTMLT